MCGIAGFVNFNDQPASKNLVKQMTDRIAHRGPDDQGLEVIGQVALGNRRLAIMDLSPKGHMPMWNQTKTLCITYNGEIYNFLSLKNQLQQKGYRFRSSSDTEVILNLYHAYGIKAISMLRGMFALAIWDTQTQSLFLARDQAGIKPLHYYLDSQVFIFASEIKSILLHPRVKKKLNPQALSHYFSLGFGCIGSPESIFQGVYKLPPAHYLIVSGVFSKKPSVQTKRYWHLPCLQQPPKPAQTFQTEVQTMRTLIEKSVQSQLVADVPLGTFLSGGLDSSLITAFAQRHTKDKVKTFSIGFEDADFDESAYSHQVAKHLKTDHHHQTFAVTEMLDILPRVVSQLDEPLADSSLLPTFLLSQFTRKSVTVALSGDGGDELFGGYPTYLAHNAAQYANWLPQPLQVLAKHLSYWGSDLLQLLPLATHAPNISMHLKLQRFFEGLDRDLVKQYLNFMGPMMIKEKDCLLLNHQETALPYTQRVLQDLDPSQRSTQKLLQFLDYSIYLQEDCLVKTDRASSFNSLEVRVPFLVPEVIDYAFALPSDYHVYHGQLKRLLKSVAQDILPDSIIHRPKKGFGIPLQKWLREDLALPLQALLAPSRIKKQGIFNSDYVVQLIKQHQSQTHDHRQVLWNLFIFQQWWDAWMQ